MHRDLSPKLRIGDGDNSVEVPILIDETGVLGTTVAMIGPAELARINEWMALRLQLEPPERYFIQVDPGETATRFTVIRRVQDANDGS
jgi:hypothetical protein